MRYYVGYEAQATRLSALAQPKAPANYKDPAKISAYLVDAQAKRQAEASSLPITSMIVQLLIMDDVGNYVVSYVTNAQEDITLRATKLRVVLNFIRAAYNDSVANGIPKSDGPIFVGFGAPTAFQSLAYEALAAGIRANEFPFRQMVRPNNWIPTESFFVNDPINMLMPSALQDRLESLEVLRILLQDPEFTIGAHSRDQVAAARAISTKLGL